MSARTTTCPHRGMPAAIVDAHLSNTSKRQLSQESSGLESNQKFDQVYVLLTFDMTFS